VGGYVAGTTVGDKGVGEQGGGPIIAVFLVIAGAMSVGGYLLGRQIDKREADLDESA
jgi:hypothetical protein